MRRDGNEQRKRGRKRGERTKGWGVGRERVKRKRKSTQRRRMGVSFVTYRVCESERVCVRFERSATVAAQSG